MNGTVEMPEESKQVKAFIKACELIDDCCLTCKEQHKHNERLFERTRAIFLEIIFITGILSFVCCVICCSICIHSDSKSDKTICLNCVFDAWIANLLLLTIPVFIGCMTYLIALHIKSSSKKSEQEISMRYKFAQFYLTEKYKHDEKLQIPII